MRPAISCSRQRNFNIFNETNLKEGVVSTTFRSFLIMLFSLLLCSSAFAGWTKSVEKDDFDDKVFKLWFTATRTSGALEFVFGCDNSGKFSLYWQYARNGQSGVPAMDMGVVYRLDSDPPVEEEWSWLPMNANIRPKDASAFMKKMISKKKLAIKTTLGGDVGVFDISGANKAYQEAKNTCKLP
jgi:hypothetical protein